MDQPVPFNRRWIVNASPLVSLGKVGQIHLLSELSPRLIIPEEVADEVRAGPVSDAARQWVLAEGSRFIWPSVVVDPRIAVWDLGAGESAVLSLGLLGLGSELILDDKAAPNAARTLRLSTIGAVGVIVIARQHELIERAAPVLEALQHAGMHLQRDVVERALALVGESA